MGVNVLFANLDKREWVSPSNFGGSPRAGAFMLDEVALVAFAAVCRGRWNGDRIAVVFENDSQPLGITDDPDAEPYYVISENFKRVAREVGPLFDAAWKDFLHGMDP